MEIKGALTLPRNEDNDFYDTFAQMILDSMNTINKARAEEILAEKGDRQILEVIKDTKEARDKKWKEKEYPSGTILPEGHKKTYRSASVIKEEGGEEE